MVQAKRRVRGDALELRFLEQDDAVAGGRQAWKKRADADG